MLLKKDTVTTKNLRFETETCKCNLEYEVIKLEFANGITVNCKFESLFSLMGN